MPLPSEASFVLTSTSPLLDKYLVFVVKWPTVDFSVWGGREGVFVHLLGSAS